MPLLAAVCCWHWWWYFLSLCCSPSVFFSFQNCQALFSLKAFARCFDYLFLYNRPLKMQWPTTMVSFTWLMNLQVGQGLGEDGSCLPCVVLLGMASLGAARSSPKWVMLMVIARWCWLSALTEIQPWFCKSCLAFLASWCPLVWFFCVSLCFTFVKLFGFVGLGVSSSMQNFPTVISSKNFFFPFFPSLRLSIACVLGYLKLFHNNYIGAVFFVLFSPCFILSSFYFCAFKLASFLSFCNV